MHNFLKDEHLDAELRTLIQLNHKFYRFIYSSVINVIYFNTKEVHIQERFVLQFDEWQAKAENERKAIMKKQKCNQENIELEIKLEEMNVQKKIQKLSAKEFKMKKRSAV